MTALTADQIANTTADQFTVRHRYFASGTQYNTLTLAHYQVQPPTGWTVAGSVITTPAGWTEITDSVYWEGSFTEQWDEDRQYWQADLRGQDYDSTLLSLGMTVAGFVRYTRGVYDTGWTLEWLGAVTKYNWANDYRNGENWDITFGGTDTQLERHDAPRLVAGAINLIDGASISPSDTLVTPASEAGNGEFVGATVDVSADKMIDGRMNTLWISELPPSITGDTKAAACKINEVFFKPVAGYAAANVWWIEIFNNTEYPLPLKRQHLIAYTAAGKECHIQLAKSDSNLTLGAYEFMIVCRNRALAESYVGSFQQAAIVLETDTLSPTELLDVYDQTIDGTTYQFLSVDTAYCQFDLNPTGGWVFWWEKSATFYGGGFQDAVKWGTSVTGPDGADWSQWTGAPVDISALVAGQSIRRVPACGDSGTNAEWTAGIPSPGDYFSETSARWFKVELAPHESTLTVQATTTSTTLTFAEGAQGWPWAGQGVCEGDVFDYTGRTANTLTGVSNISADHAIGAAVYPYVDASAQTGWRLSDITVRRPPGLPRIKRLRCWTSPYADIRTYDEASFWVDYVEPFYTIENGTFSGTTLIETGAVYDIKIQLLPPSPTTAGRWVRTFLIAIDAMWGDGRAKVNELLARGTDMEIGGTFAPTIGTTRVADLAAYLLDSYTWLAAADFTDNTGDSWGVIGNVATAVRPVPTVLADLARSHGCVVRYAPTGQVSFERNPWWPSGTGLESPPMPLYIFTTSDVRGELRSAAERSTLTGVAVMAHDPSGAVLPRMVFPPTATGSQVTEITDVTLRDEIAAINLAFYTYLKMGMEVRVELIVKGIGDWCQPRQRVVIDRGDGYVGQWIIERVTRRWRYDQDRQQFETTLDLRSYMGMP